MFGTQNLLTWLGFGWKQLAGQMIGPWAQVWQIIWHFGSHNGLSDECICIFFFYHNSFEGIFNLLNAGVGKVLALLFHKHMPVLIVCRHRASPGFYVYAEDSMALRKQTPRWDPNTFICWIAIFKRYQPATITMLMSSLVLWSWSGIRKLL